MIYFAVISFAVLPSIVWMLYYLRQDSNPEPKRFIIYVFLAGSVFGLLNYLFQLEMKSLLEGVKYFIFIEKFIIVAFSEEFFKYLAVYFTMMRNSELDEPIDVIIYMIVAALGFAALENLFYLKSLGPDLLFEEMAILATLRFAGATFLHTLASGTLGVFLVYGYRLSSRVIMLCGFVIATTLHAAYNMIVVRLESPLFLLLLILFLVSFWAVLFLYIKRIKKMKSICLAE